MLLVDDGVPDAVAVAPFVLGTFDEREIKVR
jgi:hypothetical protein